MKHYIVHINGVVAQVPAESAELAQSAVLDKFIALARSNLWNLCGATSTAMSLNGWEMTIDDPVEKIREYEAEISRMGEQILNLNRRIGEFEAERKSDPPFTLCPKCGDTHGIHTSFDPEKLTSA